MLRERSDIAVALATGGWGRTARLKLKAAGINVEGVAFASADDSFSRREIMLISRERAAAKCGVRDFDSFVYVGDAVWDLAACRSLGIPLIGIGTGARAALLQAEGARYLLPDYADCQKFLDCMAAARLEGRAV